MGHKNKVDSIKDIIRQSGDKNNKLSDDLNGSSKTNSTGRIILVKDRASMISEEMRNVSFSSNFDKYEYKLNLFLSFTDSSCCH